MSSYFRKVLRYAQGLWPAGNPYQDLADWNTIVGDLVSGGANPSAGQIQTAVNLAARREYILGIPVLSDQTVYLWRNFATTGARANEHEIYVPFAAGRYSVYSFQDYIASSGGAYYFGRLKEGRPVINLPAGDAAVTKVGVWTTSGNAAAYNGVSLQSTTAGDTMSVTLTGHTLILRTIITTNGGFALVSIDGDAVNGANRLPVVVQADVDAGYFVVGDLGKRYYESYGPGFEDEHLVLADNLTDAPHTVLITAKGTKRAASSATRAYASGFARASAGISLTDANASMGYVRDITNLRSPNTFSKMTLAPEFTPTGFVNYQYMGGNHGNETLVSQNFKVDGVLVTPTAGQLIPGTTITSELFSSLIHPSTGATVQCAKHGVYTATAAAGMRYVYELDWQAAGTARNSYYGMMHLGMRQYAVSALQQPMFDRFLVGNMVITSAALNNESQLGLSLSDLSTAFSTLHDTVASVYMPRPDLNVDNFSRTGTGAFLQDRTDLTEKFYFARSSTAGPEAITAATLHTGEIQWRLTSIPNAATVLLSAVSPADVGGGTLTGWWSADSLTLGNNDPVSTWTARSPTVHNATQTLTARPLFKTGIQNGLPGVLFTAASSQWMAADGLASIQSGADLPLTVFIVHKQVSTTGQQAHCAWGRSTTATPFHDLCQTNNVYQSSRRDDSTGLNTQSALAPGTAAAVVSWVFTGTAISLWKNGSPGLAAVAQNVGTLTINTFSLGGMRNLTVGEFYDGYLFEVLVYSSALSTGDRQTIERNLGAKWGISVA